MTGSAPVGRYDRRIVTPPRTRRILPAIVLATLLIVIGAATPGVAPASAQVGEGSDAPVVIDGSGAVVTDPAAATDDAGVADEPDAAGDSEVSEEVDEEEDPVVADPAPVDTDAVDREAVKAEDRRMIIVVGGLVAVAVALLLLTIRYWRVTRPVTEPIQGDELRHTGAERRRFGRRSRRAIAGADHAGADADWQPRSTSEQEAVRAPEDLSRQRPSRGMRSRMLSSDG